MPTRKLSHASIDPGTPPRDRERILGLAVNTLGRNIIWNLAQRTARHRVLPGQYPIIAWLMQLPYLTQADLSRIVGIEQPTMAVTLRRMERDGLIVRRPDPEHARKILVSLTPRGKKLSRTIRQAAFAVERIAYAGLSRDQIKEFFRLAGRMTQNLNAARRKETREVPGGGQRKAANNRKSRRPNPDRGAAGSRPRRT
jgi:DNA-binding MarR family transcriptional regulator